MKLFSTILNILQETSLNRNWDLNDDEYMKIFSWMLYIILEQQWTSLMMMRSCQWSSKSRMILKWITADSELIIAKKTSETSINKEIWIASISNNWKMMRLIFEFLLQMNHHETEQKWMSRNAKLSAYVNISLLSWCRKCKACY